MSIKNRIPRRYGENPFSSSPSRLRSGHGRKIIHFSLNFGSDPATDTKRLLLKGSCIENRIFFRFPGVSDPAADV